MAQQQFLVLDPVSLSAHPAVRAWHRVCRAQPTGPKAVEPLMESRKTSVFRLIGVGREGETIIAKRYRAESAQVERTVFQAVLPELPVRTLEYYGTTADDDAAFAWLFLEDAAGEPYAPDNPAHRHAAARWLATLHTCRWHSRLAKCLPEVGAPYYHGHLLAACTRIAAYRNSPGLTAETTTMLDRLLGDCHKLLDGWGRLQQASERLPATVVHGDFVEKNVRMRPEKDGWLCLPFDWDMAGWGTSLADLAECHALDAYRLQVEPVWPRLCVEEWDYLANCGKLFRLTAALSWLSWRFAYPSQERALRWLRDYATDLPQRLAVVFKRGG